MPEKYEKEIEDILANYGESESPVEGQYPQQQAGHVQEPGFSNSSKRHKFSFALTPAKIMLVGAVVLLLAWIRFPLLIWPALGIFLMAYLLIYRKPGGGSTGYEKKWRGKVIEERKSGLERIKDWFRS